MSAPHDDDAEHRLIGAIMLGGLDGHAQSETRDVAKMINDLVPKEFQHSWKALSQ